MSLTKNERKIQSEPGKILPREPFAAEIAGALHRQYAGAHGAAKLVVQLTGANERTVRNWFDGKNGPNGESLIALCRHSDEVLVTVLRMAGRTTHIRAVRIALAQQTAHALCGILDALDGSQ
jgi:hypothetical protein